MQCTWHKLYKGYCLQECRRKSCGGYTYTAPVTFIDRFSLGGSLCRAAYEAIVLSCCLILLSPSLHLFFFFLTFHPLPIFWVYLHSCTSPTEITVRASVCTPIKIREPLNGYSRNLILVNFSINCLAVPKFITIITDERSLLGCQAPSLSDGTSRRFERSSHLHLQRQTTRNWRRGPLNTPKRRAATYPTTHRNTPTRLTSCNTSRDGLHVVCGRVKHMSA